MAKSRNGSINIYGPLEAKTADGIVAFTDSIVKENEDGTRTPLDEILENAGGIIDVTELPNIYGWKGTPVTKDTRRVYFNTALSGEEVNKIIDEYEQKSGFDQLNIEDYEGEYNIIIDSATHTISMNYEDVIVFQNGEWLIDYNYIDISWKIISIVGDSTLLSMLISSTPFIKETFNDKTIYRLEEQDTSKLVEVKGQAIPCDDKTYIGSVRINPNLTDEQILEIIESINFEFEDVDSSYAIYRCVDTESNYFSIFKNRYGKYDILNGDDRALWSNSDEGYESIEYVEIKGVSTSTYDGQPIGLQNDKLKDLFYYTTYGTKTNLYTYDGEWHKIITDKDFNDTIGNINAILDAINGEVI